MKRISSGTLGIAQGNDVIFEDFQDGGEMWTGTGNREKRKQIVFRESFKTPPLVQCSLSLWDVDSQTNVRADLEAESITTEGFELVFRTWGDTKVARVRASWIALGEVSNADDWELY